MTSERKIAANRRNSLRSTGPKTPQGKARVGENAVTHGLTTQRAVLRGEDAAEYEKLRADVFARWEPDGAMEERMAKCIASFHWRIGRSERVENAFFDNLVRREVGRRAFEIDASGAVIAGKLHTFEKEKEALRFEAAKDIEPTDEDIQSALAASVMDVEAMKANRLIDAKRQADLRGLARCEKLLEAMQKRRFENEPPPRFPVRNGPRRNIAQADD
jgi:hypothetical protein